MAAICVFCGSKPGSDPVFRSAARSLGRFLAENGHTTVYGGGSVGLMGELADEVLRCGGRITGVITRHLARAELMHADVPDMRITADMHERKALMHSLADAYVALPGGYGTMEELFEAVTWAQLELHALPIAVLNVGGLYDGLQQLIAGMAAQGFLSDHCRSLITVADSDSGLHHWIEGLFSPTMQPGNPAIPDHPVP